MFVPAISIDEEQLNRGVKKVESQFATDVARIRYSIGEDWAQDPAIFFRILVTKDMGPRDWIKLPEKRAEVLRISDGVSEALRNEINTDVFQPYFSFRTVSEQEKLHDPEWE